MYWKIYYNQIRYWKINGKGKTLKLSACKLRNVQSISYTFILLKIKWWKL